MFYIDRQTIDYLKLTGRERGAGRSWSRTTPRPPACGPTAWSTREYERVLSSICRPWCATWPARPTRTRASPTSDLAAQAASPASLGREGQGQMPDGAVIIAAITSCTNTSNPRNVVAAALLARKANRARPGAQALGQVLARARAPRSPAVSGRGRAADRAGAARLRHRRLRLHHLQRHVRRAGPEDPAGNHRPRPVRHRRAVRQPQLRRPHPPVCQAGLPGLAAAGGRLRHRRHHPLRHREGRAGHGQTARRSA